MDTGLGRPLAESVAGAGADAGSEGALEVEQRRHVVLLLLRQGRRRGRDGGGGEEDVESEEDGGGGGAAEEGHLLGKAVADEDPDPDLDLLEAPSETGRERWWWGALSGSVSGELATE